MYIPPRFAETDPEVLADLIARHPLGLLVTAGAAGLTASPVPFLWRLNEGKPTLVAHLARANPHCKELQTVADCLVVFQGAQGYVTPSWYPSKQTTHQVVPTWNYEMVQVKGRPTLIDSPDWLRQQVGQLTEAMEHTREAPWQVSDAPKPFIATQLKALVGLEIAITDITGKWKMSQNRPTGDAAGVAAGLADPQDPHAHAALSAIVASRLSKTRG